MSSKWDKLPIAILCGGEYTRANTPINKCFIEIHGKPFLLHILEQMERQGYSTFVLCRGTSGTLNALRDARHQLGPKFLVLYGDTIIPELNIADFVAQWYWSNLPSAVAEIGGIDAGVLGFTSRMLDMVPDEETSLVALQAELRTCRLVHHYEAPGRWQEVGSPEAITNTKLMLK
jgi:NDP-sugar pyrophosphorylase family protein